MSIPGEPIDISVDGELIAGTLVSPSTKMPGVLFIQGWGSNQDQYLARAREIAALGCVCLTFEPRGVAKSDPRHRTVTRDENLRDVLSAYDVLAGRHDVASEAIGVVGSSYGGYLAAILSAMRPVRWLTLRAPALYKDENWAVPKEHLDRNELVRYRQNVICPEDNRALRACAAFKGDVLIIESEYDDVVPHPVIANYRTAFEAAHSLTYRVISGADHGLSEETYQQSYASILVNWAAEMVVGVREKGSVSGIHVQLPSSLSREPPTSA
jgi:uncharacterized protein